MTDSEHSDELQSIGVEDVGKRGERSRTSTSVTYPNPFSFPIFFPRLKLDAQITIIFGRKMINPFLSHGIPMWRLMCVSMTMHFGYQADSYELPLGKRPPVSSVM